MNGGERFGGHIGPLEEGAPKAEVNPADVLKIERADRESQE
jgi:hypothetical protein